MRIIALILLFFVQTAWAAVPEQCGNGIDDPLATGGSSLNGAKGACNAGYMDARIGLGCDKKCPAPDQDRDGYTSDGSTGLAGTAYTDCDDTNRDDYPGQYIPNSYAAPTGYKQCQTNGTYTSTILNATTPLCEATGSGVCKYIHCGTGNNSNAGTYASPYLTIGKIAGGSSGSLPASPYTLAAGDVVYLLGGTCSTTYNDGGAAAVQAEITTDGTLANPITIKNYPGATAPISSTSRVFNFVGSDYIHFDSLDIDPTLSAFYTTSQLVGFELSRSWIHDLAANGDNNNACVQFDPIKTSNIHHNYFEDCLRSSGNVTNTACVTNLVDPSEVVGLRSEVAFNTMWATTKSSTANGSCLFLKHGTLLADCHADGCFLFHDNDCINMTSGVTQLGSGAIVKRNRFIDSKAMGMTDGTSSGAHEGNVFKHNVVDSYETSFTGGLINWPIPNFATSTTQNLANTYNVFIDRRSSYAAGNSDGVMSFGRYCSDAQKTQFESNGCLTSDNNCFYSPSATAVFSYFSQSSGTEGTCGAAGAAGSDYSFANWKGTVVEDTASFLENPTLDTNGLATSSNCLTFGRYLTPESSGSGSASARKGQKNGSGRKGQK